MFIGVDAVVVDECKVLFIAYRNHTVRQNNQARFQNALYIIISPSNMHCARYIVNLSNIVNITYKLHTWAFEGINLEKYMENVLTILCFLFSSIHS